MKSVHISQFYSCSSISLASELYYVCELGKYLYLNYGEVLSLDGVLFKAILKRSNLWDMFRIAIANGWVVDSNVDSDDVDISIQNPLDYETKNLANVQITLEDTPFDREDYNKRRDDLVYNLMTPLKSQVSFTELKDDYWYWSFSGAEGNNFLINNKTLNSNNANQVWLSLIAYVAVERLKTGKPNKLLLQFDHTIVNNTMALSYIILLTDESNCFTGWCFFNFDSSITERESLHFSYTTWYMKGKDMGYLSRYYSPDEKLERLKKMDIKVGDIVWIYERNKEQKMNYIKSISGCFFAKITKIDARKKRIGFECILTKNTFSQAKHDFDDKTIAVKRMYGAKKPYEELRFRKEDLDLNDIGIEYLMHTELYMLVPLNETEDSSIQYVSDDSRKYQVEIPQNDLIYWILKDYGYEFNEDRFLAKYFDNETPMYTRFHNGEDLPIYEEPKDS